LPTAGCAGRERLRCMLLTVPYGSDHCKHTVWTVWPGRSRQPGGRAQRPGEAGGRTPQPGEDCRGARRPSAAALRPRTGIFFEGVRTPGPCSYPPPAPPPPGGAGRPPERYRSPTSSAPLRAPEGGGRGRA
jgi:hypothetical protein